MFFFLTLLAVSNYYANQCSVLAVVALSETMLGCCMYINCAHEFVGKGGNSGKRVYAATKDQIRLQ